MLAMVNLKSVDICGMSGVQQMVSAVPARPLKAVRKGVFISPLFTQQVFILFKRAAGKM